MSWAIFCKGEAITITWPCQGGNTRLAHTYVPLHYTSWEGFYFKEGLSQDASRVGRMERLLPILLPSSSSWDRLIGALCWCLINLTWAELRNRAAEKRIDLTARQNVPDESTLWHIKSWLVCLVPLHSVLWTVDHEPSRRIEMDGQRWDPSRFAAAL